MLIYYYILIYIIYNIYLLTSLLFIYLLSYLLSYLLTYVLASDLRWSVQSVEVLGLQLDHFSSYREKSQLSGHKAAYPTLARWSA